MTIDQKKFLSLKKGGSVTFGYNAFVKIVGKVAVSLRDDINKT